MGRVRGNIHLHIPPWLKRCGNLRPLLALCKEDVGDVIAHCLLPSNSNWEPQAPSYTLDLRAS